MMPFCEKSMGVHGNEVLGKIVCDFLERRKFAGKHGFFHDRERHLVIADVCAFLRDKVHLQRIVKAGGNGIAAAKEFEVDYDFR